MKGGNLMQLTEHFKLEDFAVSHDYPELAKKIKFSKEDITKLFYICQGILEPAREVQDKPIIITSGKRTLELNKAVGGAPHSDHLFRKYSCAVDFTTKEEEELFDIYYFIYNHYYYFVGELIIYFNKVWVPRFLHLSLPTLKHHHQFFYDYDYGKEFEPIYDAPNGIYYKLHG